MRIQVVTIAILALAAASAHAQITPGTACGQAGTGYVVGHNGRPVLQTRTAEQAKASARHGTRVAADGYWTVCDEPVTAKPAAPVLCLARDTWEEWADGDAVCSSMPPGAYTGTTSRLTVTEEGRARLIRDEWGIHQGMAIYRCVRGAWKLEGSYCKRAQ